MRLYWLFINEMCHERPIIDARSHQLMPSFDIVSEVDLHQLTNAVDQANRIIKNRFDFKGVEARFERDQRVVTLFAEAEFQLQQMLDMLQSTLHKCNIDIDSMDRGKTSQTGNQCKQVITLKHGIDTDTCNLIV